MNFAASYLKWKLLYPTIIGKHDNRELSNKAFHTIKCS
jgi:hypothetical protein